MNSEKLKDLFDEMVGPKRGLHKENENANIDTNTAMGSMLKFGGEASKDYYLNHLLNKKDARLHKQGFIHIHDLDFYGLTTTCCQIDIDKLFKHGFNTGHGYIRPPQTIQSYSALACIVLQSNQNDQHGGQALPNFDRSLAEGVRKSFQKNREKLWKIASRLGSSPSEEEIDELAWEQTDKDTFQAMESLVHNLNTMAGRAGAQVPFTSINYGTDTSREGRMVVKNILLATEKGLGNGETPVFPIQIFRVQSGVNMNPGDPNEDLFDLACRVSSKRLFPNFSFQDAPFNKQYLQEGKPETEIAYMGCRSRVIGNVHDKSREITYGRGNLSFTSINLPRLALEARQDQFGDNVETVFIEYLDDVMDDVFAQLQHRFDVQKERLVRNYPFLMGEGVWIDSEKLSMHDKVEEVLKHGTLAVGFVGLAECLTELYRKHHGKCKESQEKGLMIIKHMRDRCDAMAKKTGLNFSLIATPAESLAGRFLRIDREKFGEVDGVTDKEFYTNSFHIPVDFKITFKKKIDLEAPYHALTNGGHVTTVEADASFVHNTQAFKDLVKHMAKAGIGYGAINHPIDYDEECGFRGVIGDTCPKCGRKEGDKEFKRIRRITGYLVGNMSRWNHAKRHEELMRTKHDTE